MKLSPGWFEIEYVYFKFFQTQINSENEINCLMYMFSGNLKQINLKIFFTLLTNSKLMD